jgi:pyruvate kinase
MISRFSPGVWIVALSHHAAVCQGLVFSYGVHPIHIAREPENWSDFVRKSLGEYEIPGALSMLVAGPSTHNPGANHRLEFVRTAGPQVRPHQSRSTARISASEI